MTKKQIDELLKTLKGIEAALLLLRVPNTGHVPYSQPPYIAPNTTPFYNPSNQPIMPLITCETGHAEGFKGNVQVHS